MKIDVTKIRPMLARLLLKEEPYSHPDLARHYPMLATVLAAGPKAKGFKVGDRVLVQRYAGVEFAITTDEAAHFIVSEDDVLAKVLP